MVKAAWMETAGFRAGALILCCALAGCDDVGEKEVVGYISAMAPVVWACPLHNWQRGDDAGCDPIETGTRITIHKRDVRPDYRHGPFALIEYNYAGSVKMQYVKDINVTPLNEDDPSTEDLIQRMQDAVGRGPR